MMGAAKKIVEEQIEEPETGEVEQLETEPEAEEDGKVISRTLMLQKIQNKIVGLLERSLKDDEEGKQRVIRGTAAILGIAT